MKTMTVTVAVVKFQHFSTACFSHFFTAVNVKNFR